MRKEYALIIWDWNGTLFNDLHWCMEVMNIMLAKRKLRPIPDIEAYHEVFCFPISDYYKNIGFDFIKDPFENLAAEFVEMYHENKSGNCKLQIHTEDILKSIHQNGITQIILSASKRENLLSQLLEFDINHYFDEILGLTDIYAKNKIEIGLDYMFRNNVKEGLIIGDTVHDYELATALGIDCLLISSGYQSKEALLACGVPVLDDISDVLKFIEL